MTTPATSDQKPAYDVTVWLESSLVLSRVTDACTTPITQTFSYVETVVGCTVTVTRTWTAVDACTKTGTATQTVTHFPYTTLFRSTPATSGPLGCNPTAAEINTAFGTPTVTDACTTPITPTFARVDTVVSWTATVTRTWTAVDACTNTGTATQTVTYTRDVTPPVIT